MDIVDAILLGIIEGITEFLPISSTGHLTIAEKLLGYQIDAPGITSYTAVIQIGAILAAVIYFWSDISRVFRAWVRGLFDKRLRKSLDYRLGWYVICGSFPIAIIGLLFKNQIESTLRSLWVVVIGLLVWSLVLYLADKVKKINRTEKDLTMKDAVYIGLVQCIALIPGVSRSGATIAAGLFRGLDRVTATRMSFFLGIPALVAAGILEASTGYSGISSGVGWGAAIIGIVVSFGVGYLAVAWLMKFISSHNFRPFVWYRVVIALIIIVLLASNTITAV